MRNVSEKKIAAEGFKLVSGFGSQIVLNLTSVTCGYACRHTQAHKYRIDGER
jgi:hypothetical protein